MITSPNNFQVRKRKWKTVLFLLRKRKRNIDHHLKHPIGAEIFNGIHGGDSRRRNDAYCSGGDERDVNPRNYVDRIFEGSGKVNPRLGLDNVDAYCSGVDARDVNPRNDVDRKLEGFGKVNPRSGLDNDKVVDVDVGVCCSGVDERGENPRDDVDCELEGMGKVSPRLDLDNVDDDDDANCSGVDERGENSREDDVGWGFEGSGKENSRLGLDHVVGEEGEEEEVVVDESSKSAVMVVSERKKDGEIRLLMMIAVRFALIVFQLPVKQTVGTGFVYSNCILQFWTYRTVLQKCNCPICARPISKLTPEASLNMMNEVEVVEVLKNVQRYNRLFQGGINGVIRKAFEVPNLFTRMLCGLMDPDRFRGNYYAMRSFALLMSCIYNIGSFEFIPTGTLGVRRLFDLCAIALVVILCLVGICHRLLLRQRVRRLAANQP
ncbi:hypothetical protein HanIR_Chr03g0112881 [Helianthus annuus]|nr:hypothetical protein HanIR_Chr03g0112881 [Helianthus annuus]